MWATLGRFVSTSSANDQDLTRTAQAIAEGAARFPGHVSTRLFATTERDELFCMNTFEVQSSAETYARVLRERPDAVAAGYQSMMADFTLLEEIASFSVGEADDR